MQHDGPLCYPVIIQVFMAVTTLQAAVFWDMMSFINVPVSHRNLLPPLTILGKQQEVHYTYDIYI